MDRWANGGKDDGGVWVECLELTCSAIHLYLNLTADFTLWTSCPCVGLWYSFVTRSEQLFTWSDWWLIFFLSTKAAKMANYAKCQILCNLLFAMFAILFISSRLGVYPVWWVSFSSMCTTASILEQCYRDICIQYRPYRQPEAFKTCAADAWAALQIMADHAWKCMSVQRRSQCFFFLFCFFFFTTFSTTVCSSGTSLWILLLSNSYYGYSSFDLSKKAKQKISKWKADDCGYCFIIENSV